MTKTKGFTVTLSQDIEDAESIISAIQMIKGVIHVEPSLVTNDDHMARVRIKFELTDAINDFVVKNLMP